MSPAVERRLLLLARHLGSCPSRDRLAQALPLVETDHELVSVLRSAGAGGPAGYATFTDLYGVLERGDAEASGFGLLDLVTALDALVDTGPAGA